MLFSQVSGTGAMFDKAGAGVENHLGDAWDAAETLRVLETPA